MTDYESIIIFAVRYALGRRTYAVKITVDYVIAEMPKLSEQCRLVMIEDIEQQEPFGYGEECDEEDWMRLLGKLKGRE